MKSKFIRTVGYIAAVITIFTSIIYFISDNNIPGLAPFSLAIVMFSMVLSTQEQFKNGKVSSSHWKFILIIGLTAGIVNMIVSILQLSSVIIKN